MIRSLLLVPTPLELSMVEESLLLRLAESHTIEVCGFGMAVAAARTASLIAKWQPSRILLLGIAGGFGDESSIGKAIQFSEVACYGIGAGTGLEFRSASEMGWMQWSGDKSDQNQNDCGGTISDLISLVPCQGSDHENPKLLLSVTSASQNSLDVELRTKKYPHAIAEDMEGFAVAAACRLAGKSLEIVRGISNTAGDRNHAHWRTREAMNAAAKLALGDS